MDKQRQADIERPFERHQTLRVCAAPGCAEEAPHRAPLSPHRPGEFQWFCLEHVREFNDAWNACQGLNEAEIESLRRADSVWQRPSWPFSGAWSRAAGTGPGIHDPFGFFADARQEKPRQTPQSDEEKALALLGLGCEATLECVKTRYKELVKKLHPDANGRDSEAEDRLKAVNQAYATLKSSFTR